MLKTLHTPNIYEKTGREQQRASEKERDEERETKPEPEQRERKTEKTNAKDLLGSRMVNR